MPTCLFYIYKVYVQFNIKLDSKAIIQTKVTKEISLGVGDINHFNQNDLLLSLKLC